MSSNNINLTLTSLAGSERAQLLTQIRALGARPFFHQVVQSPWNPIVDAPSLHRKAKDAILEIIENCGRPGAARSLTVFAPAGYGKTHLLAWTRQKIEERNDAVFIYVPPYTPGCGPLANHLLRATVNALSLRSLRQRRLLEGAVLRFLVGSYDDIVDSRTSLRDLNAGRGLISWLLPRFLRIGKHGEEAQLAALQRAFRRRRFLERAFDNFKRLHPPDADGVQADWEIFVAACLLACGNTKQHWHAERWLDYHPMPPAVREPYHLDHPCQGQEKIRNGLFTLNRLAGQTFLFGFDQMEDTYRSFEKDDKLDDWLGQMTLIVRNLGAIPGFCLVFMFQEAIWVAHFSQKAPPMLRDRMIEGYGALELQALDDNTARELICCRMEQVVWKELAPQKAPEGEPCFPFAVDEIQVRRRQANSDLRAFLQNAHERYMELVAPVKPPSIELIRVEPSVIISGEARALLIHGRHLPPDVKVFFADSEVETVTCRPEAGQIDVTSPTDLEGEIVIRVEAADDPQNSASLKMQFIGVPSPYAKHIDRDLLRKWREELHLAQKQVAEKLGKSHAYISHIVRLCELL